MQKNIGKVVEMKKIIILAGLLMLVAILMLPSIDAGSCRYGTMYAWYSKDGENWSNATAYDTGKLGEPFYVKVELTAKTDLMGIYFRIDETADAKEGSSFEMLEGPIVLEGPQPTESPNYPCDDCFFCYCSFMDIKENETVTLKFKLCVKEDNDWIGGTAPVEVFTLFSIDDDVDCDIYFHAVNIAILEETWDGLSNNDSSNLNGSNGSSDFNNGTPGFELVVVLLALSVVLYYRRKTKS